MKKIFIFLGLISILFSVFAMENISNGSGQLVTLGGKVLSYEELTASPKTILFIWSTWCPSCRVTINDLAKKCATFKDVKIFYVDTGEKASTLDNFLRRKDPGKCVKDNMVLDEEAVIANRFSVFAIPTFIFLRNGELVYRSHVIDDTLIKQVFDNR